MREARGATQVEEIYLALLTDARRDASRPSPGKVTRTMRLEAERAGKKRRNARVSPLTGQPIAPGKVTLTSYLAPREPAFRDRPSDIQGERAHVDMMRAVFARPSESTPHVADELERTLDALLGTSPATSQRAWASVDTAEEAWIGEESWAVEEPGTDAMHEAPWPDEAVMADRQVEHLPDAIRARMARACGQDFDEVVIHPDSPEATGATRALTRGNEIHFRTGAYEPGTAAGDWLIAHELAHMVQQTARPGQSAGRRALESEADLAASAILAGRSAAVSLGASMSAALAFSDDEDHDVDEEETSTPASADADTAPASPDASGATAGLETGAPATADGASEAAAIEPPASGAADTATETSVGPDVEGAEGDEAALLAEIRTPVAAEGGPAGGGGAGGGGGGEAVPVEAAAPEVSGTPPEQGLAALQGVRPDKLAGALDGVRTAASSEVSQERSALATDPPQQMSTGDAAAAAAPGAGAPGGAVSVAAGQDTTAAGQAGTAGQPGAAAAGEDAQAAQGKVNNADTTAGSNESPPPVAATRAPAVDNAPADENNARGGMSETDAARMSEAVATVPTKDPHVNTDPGPAPELAMTEDARASAQTDRDSLDTSLTGAGTTAATHIAQPMGEDHTDVTLAPEALKAQLTAGDTAAEAGAAVAGAGKALGAAKTEALGDAGESAAIIAKLERGAEIDAALATAQGQVVAERQAHAQRGVDERARADQELAALKNSPRPIRSRRARPRAPRSIRRALTGKPRSTPRPRPRATRPTPR